MAPLFMLNSAVPQNTIHKTDTFYNLLYRQLIVTTSWRMHRKAPLKSESHQVIGAKWK